MVLNSEDLTLDGGLSSNCLEVANDLFGRTRKRLKGLGRFKPALFEDQNIVAKNIENIIYQDLKKESYFLKAEKEEIKNNASAIAKEVARVFYNTYRLY